MKLFQGLLITISSLCVIASAVTTLLFFSLYERSLFVLAIVFLLVGMGQMLVAFKLNKQIQYEEDTEIVEDFLNEKD